MTASVPSIPPHVPPERVVDFDYIMAPEHFAEPHREVAAMLHASAPDIFYTPRNGGHWMVTRAELAREMMRRTEDFSSAPAHNPTRQFKPRMLPIQADPPDHGEYRRVLAAFFAPGNMAKLEPDIRVLARETIDDVAGKGGCEFVTEFGEIFPIRMFLRLVDGPVADRPALLKMAQKFTRSPSAADRAEAIAELGAYAGRLIPARRGSAAEDVLTRLVNSSFHGRQLTEDEEQGFAALLFLGGLDTVKSVLSFIMLYLARNPAQYRRLVDEPAIIPRAVEELMRISGASIPERAAARDLTFQGVNFRHQDRIFFFLPIYGFDGHEMADPFAVDLDREISQHLIFGAGPHRCAGSHLARIEIRVFLEEWTRRFPAFRLDPALAPENDHGYVWTPRKVPLLWP